MKYSMDLLPSALRLDIIHYFSDTTSIDVLSNRFFKEGTYVKNRSSNKRCLLYGEHLKLDHSLQNIKACIGITLASYCFCFDIQ